MKKFISFLMLTAVIASLFAINVSAEQTNQEVDVPKFTQMPTFDGIVSVEEWGSPTVHMVTEGAATVDSDEIGYNAEYGLKNTFYWFAYEGFSDSLSYDLWLRWDESYLYVAAIVEDPDPFSLPNGGEEIWNGDCLQFRVDLEGPSAIMLKQDHDFDYRTDEFNGGRHKKPWSSDRDVFNGILGLVKGETPTAWRCGKTYGDGWDMVENNGAIVGIRCIENDDDTCTTSYEVAVPWSVIADGKEFAPSAGDVYGMTVSVICSDSNTINAWLQWGHGACGVDENIQPRGTRGGSQAIVMSADSVTPGSGYPDNNDVPNVIETEPADPVVTEGEDRPQTDTMVLPPDEIVIVGTETTAPYSEAPSGSYTNSDYITDSVEDTTDTAVTVTDGEVFEETTAHTQGDGSFSFNIVVVIGIAVGVIVLVFVVAFVLSFIDKNNKNE